MKYGMGFGTCRKCRLTFFIFLIFIILLSYRRNHTAIAPIRDDEDRDIALSRIVALTDELNTSAQSLTRVHQLNLTPLPHTLISTDVTGSGIPETASPLPATGRTHPALSRLAYHASEAEAIQLDASVTACKLWSLRQAVANYSSSTPKTANQPCCSAALPGGCYRCLLASVMHAMEVLLSATPQGCDEGVLGALISQAVPVLGGLSQPIRNRLRELCVVATKDSPALVRLDIYYRISLRSKLRGANHQGEKSTVVQSGVVIFNWNTHGIHVSTRKNSASGTRGGGRSISHMDTDTTVRVGVRC